MTDAPIITRTAHKISESPPFAGVPWLTILEITVQVGLYLIDCYMKRHPDEPPQDVVAAHYHEGDYSRRLKAGMTRRAHAAARKKGVKLTRDQAVEVAIQSLDAVRTGTVDDLKAVLNGR